MFCASHIFAMAYALADACAAIVQDLVRSKCASVTWKCRAKRSIRHQFASVPAHAASTCTSGRGPGGVRTDCSLRMAVDDLGCCGCDAGSCSGGDVSSCWAGPPKPTAGCGDRRNGGMPEPSEADGGFCSHAVAALSVSCAISKRNIQCGLVARQRNLTEVHRPPFRCMLFGTNQSPEEPQDFRTMQLLPQPCQLLCNGMQTQSPTSASARPEGGGGC